MVENNEIKRQANDKNSTKQLDTKYLTTYQQSTNVPVSYCIFNMKQLLWH